MSEHHPPAQLRSVERLEVLILVDNVTDTLSTNPDHVHPELNGLVAAGMQEWGGEAICCAHFGLSLLLTVQSNGERTSLLFDAGPEAYAVARNSERLGVDFGTVEAVMLSHGHWDHAGGLSEAVARIRAARGAPVPCYLHPGMFRPRGLRLGDRVLPFKPIATPGELAQLGATPVLATHPQTLLEDQFLVSGEIPRVTPYEKGLPPHVRRAQDGGEWEPDPWIMDERFLAVHVRDKGLVVFSACSHAGIVNVLTEARNLLPDVPLHGVMGGFHLSGAAVEPIIPDTVRDLAQFDLRWIVPCHCTGWRGVNALVNAYGEAHVAPGAVGKRFTF